MGASATPIRFAALFLGPANGKVSRAVTSPARTKLGLRSHFICDRIILVIYYGTTNKKISSPESF